MDDDIRQYVKGCTVCQRDKASNRKTPGMLTHPDTPDDKWQVISMDFITALPDTVRGHNMILTVVDTFSKMVHLIACRNSADAEQTATLLFSHVFKLRGAPLKIISDRDPRWNNEVFQHILQHFGSVHAMSTSHHPQTDGQTERMNRIVEEALRHYVNDRQDDWDFLLPAIEFQINNTWQESIQSTPFFLNYGYHPTLPVDLRISQSHLADSFVSERQAAMKLGGKYFHMAMAKFNNEHLANLVSTAKQMIDAAKGRQKRYADQHRIPLSFKPEDEVMLDTKHLHITSVPSKKLFPRWLGPITVDKCIGPNAYRLRIPGHWRLHNVFNVSVLKAYNDNGRPHPPPAWTLIAGQDYQFEVEKILDHNPKSEEVKPSTGKHKRLYSQDQLKRLSFLVRWRHYGPQYDTWEPYICLRNSPESLAEYGFSTA